MDDLENCLLQCTEEARGMHVSDTVATLHNSPSPFEFYKHWVSKNVPFLLKGGVKHWPACRKWNCSFLRNKFQGKDVDVAVTPNGYADAVCEGKFVMPEERSMRFEDFLDIMEHSSASNNGDVYYIQKQNSNLLTDLPELLPDIEVGVPWATDGLEKEPDAVNFWMGSKLAITSLHKDPYENLYAVISGRKTFTLHPPCDRPFIPYQSFPQAVYKKRGELWGIENVPDSDHVPWIPVDPTCPDYEAYPMYRHAKPIHCTVEAGDLFYLPSFWFHHVTQTDSTIAVNFWYDMDFDIKYSYYQTLDKLTRDMFGR